MKKILISALIIATLTVLLATSAFAAVNFKDVSSSHSNYDAIELLADKGIILGYPGGEFRPNGNITRAEFTAVLCRALGKENDTKLLKGKTNFSDVAANHWASGYINYANNTGIISGMGKGIFDPDGKVTYEQAIKMVVASMGYSEADADAKGGYPDGYLAIGKELNLNNKINEKVGYPANRSIVAQIVYNGDFIGKPMPTKTTSAPTKSTVTPSPSKTTATPTPSKTTTTTTPTPITTASSATTPTTTTPSAITTTTTTPPTAPTPTPSVSQSTTPNSLNETEVHDAIMNMKSDYPHGMPWTNDNLYYGNGGCHAFALIVSDTVFGRNAPTRRHYDSSDIHVGDIIRMNNNSHSVVVLEIKGDTIVLVEGNMNSSIWWGREISRLNLKADYIITRYPE